VLLRGCFCASPGGAQAPGNETARTHPENKKARRLPRRALSKRLSAVRRSDQAAFGRADFAFSTTAAKAAGSWMASSESALRSTSMPDLASASMKRE